MNCVIIPFSFLAGGLAVAVIESQSAGQYVSDVDGFGAVILGLLMLFSSSYSIYLKRRSVKSNSEEKKTLNLLLLGYVVGLGMIYFEGDINVLFF